MKAGQPSAIIAKFRLNEHFEWDTEKDPPLTLRPNTEVIRKWVDDQELFFALEIRGSSIEDEPSSILVMASWPPEKKESDLSLPRATLYNYWIRKIVPQSTVMSDGQKTWRSIIKSAFKKCGQKSAILMTMYRKHDFDIISEDSAEVDPILIPTTPCVNFSGDKVIQSNDEVYHVCSKWRFLIKFVSTTHKCKWTLQFDTRGEYAGNIAYFMILNPIID